MRDATPVVETLTLWTRESGSWRAGDTEFTWLILLLVPTFYVSIYERLGVPQYSVRISTIMLDSGSFS